MASQTIIKIFLVLFVLTVNETEEWEFECEEIYKYERVTIVKTDERILNPVDHYVVKYLYTDDLANRQGTLSSMQPENLPQKCLFINYDNNLCGGMIIKGNLMYNDLRAHQIEIITRDKQKYWGWRTTLQIQRQQNAVSYNGHQLHVYEMKFIKLSMFRINSDGQFTGEFDVDTSDTRRWRPAILNRFNAHYAIVYSDVGSAFTVAAICFRLTQPRNEYNRIKNWTEYDSYFKAGGFVAVRSDMVDDSELEKVLEELREASSQRNLERISAAGSSNHDFSNLDRRLYFTRNLIDLWV